MEVDYVFLEAEGEGPAWKRTALIADDTVFMPGGLFFGSDKAAMLCASHDGLTRTLVHEQHVYLEADFVAAELPRFKDAIEVAVSDILRIDALLKTKGEGDE